MHKIHFNSSEARESIFGTRFASHETTLRLSTMCGYEEFFQRKRKYNNATTSTEETEHSHTHFSNGLFESQVIELMLLLFHRHEENDDEFSYA